MLSFPRLFVVYVSPEIKLYMQLHGPGAVQWLRRYATSRKVPGTIPGRVTGDFFLRHPTSPCARGRLSLSKMSTRIFLGVKTAGA
jgi:hypothetical protein